MADAPWRCSECGTVNEPVANACRTCGRWPSLFDLEQSTLETDSSFDKDDDDVYEARSADVEQVEPEAFDPDPPEVELPPELELDRAQDEVELPKPRGRQLARLIVPIGFVLYLLIRALVNS